MEIDESAQEENPVKPDDAPPVVEEKSNDTDRVAALEARTEAHETRINEMSDQITGVLGSIESVLNPSTSTPDSTPASLPWTHRGRRS